MENPLVLRDDGNQVSTLTLNRPEKLNALNPSLFVEFREHVNAIAKDESVGCVIITGAGSLILNGQTASIEIEVNVSTGTGSLTITGNTVTVITTSGGTGGLIMVKDDREILATDDRTITIAA